MLDIILQEIKSVLGKSKGLFVLTVLAFTCACVAINVTLTNFVLADSLSKDASESYGSRDFHKLTLGASPEIFQRVFAKENLENVKTAFEELKADPLFQFRYNIENSVSFLSFEDETWGIDDFPPWKDEFVYGYEWGRPSIYDDFIELKAFYVDELFSAEPFVSLDSGEYFSDDDFFVHSSENMIIPVIMGSSYRDLYQIGDELPNAHFASDATLTLKVIGFFEEGSYFFDNNNARQILNRYMVVPFVETTYEVVDDFKTSMYRTPRLMNTRVVSERHNTEDALERVYEILQQNGLYEFRLFDETSGAAQMVEEFKNDAVTTMTITLFVIALLFGIFCIQTYYKLLENKKKYSILIMSGITKPQLFAIIIVESLMMFFLSSILFFFLFRTFYNHQYLDMGLSNHTFVVIPLIMFVLLLFVGIFGCRKVCKFDLSSALREKE